MLKKILMKKMLAAQLKNVPETEQEKVLALLEKNPELFQKIGRDVQQKMKGGKDHIAATTEVMQQYQDELKNIL